MTATTVDVLLVEDNVADAELMLESFRGARLEGTVHVVRDGVEALDFLFGRAQYLGRPLDPPPRLVILDIKLPRVDGFEVLRELKSNERTRAIPVVMLTSSNVERDVAQCYRLGVNSYVQKPVDFDRFRETVLILGQFWLGVNAPPPATAFTDVDLR